jgi:Tfp pilus assembly protein PilX
MAGNMFFRTLAFSEAEATLQVAESVVYNQFGTVGASMPNCAAGSTLTCRQDQANGFSFLAKSAAWSGSSATTTPLNPGFSSNWMNDDLTNEKTVEEQGCQSTGAGGPSSNDPTLPCKRIYMRTTARSVDANSGALSITQQFYKFTGDVANESK